MLRREEVFDLLKALKFAISKPLKAYSSSALQLHPSTILSKWEYINTVPFIFFQRVLSVVWSGGKLGSAYYDTETLQLCLQMDVIETNDFQFLKRSNFILMRMTYRAFYFPF